MERSTPRLFQCRLFQWRLFQGKAALGALLALSLLTLPLAIGCGPESSAPEPVDGDDSSICSWTADFAFNEESLPFFFDLNASYLYLFAPINENVAYKIEGEMPYAAYTSYTTYQDNYPYASLSDSSYVMDEGSENPFITGNLIQGTPRNYTIYVTPDYDSAVNQGKSNALALPNEQDGELPPIIMMRSYYPERSNPTTGADFNSSSSYDRRGYVDQPTITAVLPDNLDTTTSCPDTSGIDPVKPELDLGDLPPEPDEGRLRWDRPPLNIVRWAGAGGISADGTEAPDPDSTCTGYLLSAVYEQDKMAITTITTIPTIFDNVDINEDSTFPSDPEVRYFSVASYGSELLSYPDQVVAGVDIVTVSDAFVVQYPASFTSTDVATVQAWASANLFATIPMSGYRTGEDFVPPVFIYRNKEVKSGFAGSIRSDVPCYSKDDGNWGNSPASNAASTSNMGNYAPISLVCESVESPVSEEQLEVCLEDLLAIVYTETDGAAGKAKS
ncbi:MAG: hypothetical protein AAGD01_14565 [Acidobacteriota bacterium]